MNTINKCTIVLENIDLQLLRQQKTRLIAIQAVFSTISPNWEIIEGMINLCDAIQDYAVDVVGLPENEVFNLTNEL